MPQHRVCLQRPAAVIEDAENQLTGSSRDLLQSLYGKLAQLDKKIADEDRRRPEAAARTRRLLDGTPYPESTSSTLRITKSETIMIQIRRL